MELDLKGKRVLITGSSSGIGLGIAKKFLEEGCSVAINGRDLDSLKRAALEFGGKNIVLVAGDVSNPSEASHVVSQAIELLGGSLDVLICNVGSGTSVHPGEETFNEWQRVFAANLWSATNTIEAAKHALITSRGSIVCISSICGIEVVPSAPITYSAAKSALNAYVRGIARPLGKYGVRINAVAPGNILHDGSVWSKKISTNPEATMSIIEREVALAVLGEAKDVANWTAWLASPKCNFVTGGIYAVDGGQLRS